MTPGQDTVARTRARLEACRAWCRASVDVYVEQLDPGSEARRFDALVHRVHRARTDDAWSKNYAFHCPVPGVDHRAYRIREIDFGDGRVVWAGIHFLGGDSAFPFVGVTAQSRWLCGSVLRDVHHALLSEFSMFAPRATWWQTTPAHELRGAPDVVGDQHLVLGAMETIRATTVPALPGAWALVPERNAHAIMRDYNAFYDEFHAAHPELRERVTRVSASDLDDCARAGALIRLVVRDRTMGLIGARPAELAGARVHEMVTIVLHRSLWGQSRAASFERAFVDRLNPTSASIVAGTIADANQPSWRTALRVGRRIVGGWAFVMAERNKLL